MNADIRGASRTGRTRLTCQTSPICARVGLIVASLLCLTLSAIAADTTYCFRLSDGSSVPLRWFSDRIVVELAQGKEPTDLAAALSLRFGWARTSLQPVAANKRLFALDLPSSLSLEDWLKQASLLASDGGASAAYPTFVHEPSGCHVTVTDEIIACLRDSATFATLEDATAPFRLQVTKRFSFDPRIVLLKVEKAGPFGALDAANTLARSAAVMWAEPNFVAEVRRTFTPDDLYFTLQWHLNNTGQVAGGVPDADIDAAEAWDITLGSRNVTIAVLDDGMNIDHPDLQANIYVNPGETPNNSLDDDKNGFVDDVNGWDFYSRDNDPRPDNIIQDYHSTCVGGLAGAVADNSIGVAGAAPGCKILPCRMMGAYAPTVNDIAEAIQYAGAMASVISISWTMAPNSTVEASLRYAATQGRGGRGCPIAASVGNNYRTDFIGFPASLDCVMAIGASTYKDVRAPYSDYTNGQGVFLLAPSGDSDQRTGVPTLTAAGGYGLFSGTSAGPPQVAGVCALMLSVAPTRSRAQIESVLRTTTDKINPTVALYDSNGYSSEYGYGRLNAYRAVLEVTPDLAATAFDFAPTTTVIGGNLKLSGSVRNLGKGASSSFWIEFWLSNSAGFATRDIQACNSIMAPSLAAGGEYKFQDTTATLRAEVGNGLYAFGMVVDRTNQRIELDETNNTFRRSGVFLQVGTGSTDVDLVVENFDFDTSTASGGETVLLLGQVFNRGNQISRVVWVEFWASTDPDGKSLDYLICDSLQVGPLGPGEYFDLATLVRTLYRPSQGLPTGTYRIGVVVDRLGAQAETNKTNNEAFRLDKWLTVVSRTDALRWRSYP